MLDAIYPWLQHQLANNDIFAGVLGGSVIATAVMLGRTLLVRLYRTLLLTFTCELEVTSEDEAYVWINEWLAHHSYAQKASRLRLNSREVYDDHGTGSHRLWSLAPGNGNHFFFFRGRLIHLSRDMSQPPAGGSQKTREIINIRVYSRGQNLVRDLVAEAYGKLTSEDTINVFCYNSYWRKVAKRRRRELDTVVMPAGFIESLVADATWFFGANAWYQERGIPYRRGYLLSGPPGCGKTSLVFALASHFKLPLYLLNLGSIRGDATLFDAISSVPERAILLIEDVDANGTVKTRTEAKGKKGPSSDEEDNSPISMSAFLNALDGVMSKDGRLLVMTTNHPERLDPAMVRAGRIDRHETIGPMGSDEVARMFLRFYPAEEAMAQRIGAMKFAIPAAQLQGLFLSHSGNVQAAFKDLAKLKKRA